MNLKKQLGRLLLDRYKRKKQAACDLSLEHCLATARAIVRRTRYAFLVTQGEGPWPSARLVEPIADLERFHFAIGTRPTLRKVREIKRCPQVTLAYGNESDNANLVVYGTARSAEASPDGRRAWKGTWRLFFPGGPKGDDYTVLEVVAERLEVLSFRHNVVPEPFGLAPVVLVRHDEKWAVEAPT